MRELFHLEQVKDFPEKFYTIIIGDKGLSCISICSYLDGIETIFAKNKISKFPYYQGFVPQTYEEEYIVPCWIKTEYKLPIFSKILVKPVYFVKFVLDRVYNVVVGHLENEKVEISSEEIKEVLHEFLKVPVEGIIIESEYKAKAFLIHAHKNYLNKHPIIRKI